MNDINLEFTGLNQEEYHHCTSYMEGQEMVWKCPHCENYERRFNLYSGEMKVKGKTNFKHTGCSGKTQNFSGLTKNLPSN